eukprot:3728147-Rhodomonas_salina.6
MQRSDPQFVAQVRSKSVAVAVPTSWNFAKLAKVKVQTPAIALRPVLVLKSGGAGSRATVA